MKRGFLTLEVLIATAIMLSTLSAVLLSTFGNQSLLTDGSRAEGAMAKARTLIAEEESREADDFNLVNPISDASGGYTNTAEVTLESDYLTKRVSAVSSWVDELGRTRSVELTTLLTNFNDASGDTCSSALAGDWTKPEVTSASLGTIPFAALDVSHGHLFAAASTTSAAADPTVYAYDLSDSQAPVRTGSIDTIPSSTLGLATLTVEGDYIYGASLSTCSKGTNCGQLQVVRVSDPTHMSVVGHLLLSTSTPPFAKDSSGTPVPANILFYKDGIVYLGLSKTSKGDEFNAIDVRDPANPKWLGGYAIGRGVNAITVRGGYAYVATDDNTAGGSALVVLDVRDPTNIIAAGGAFTAPGAGFAEAVATVGSQLYLGRTYANGTQKEFYLLDASDPAHTLPVIGTPADVGTAAHQVSVRALRIRDYLAYLLTTSDLEVWDMSSTTVPKQAVPLTAFPNASRGAAIDCEDNSVYALSNSGSASYLTTMTAD